LSRLDLIYPDRSRVSRLDRPSDDKAIDEAQWGTT